MATPAASPAPPRKVALSALSPADKRACNHMADTMDRFHAHFRSEWRTLAAAVAPATPTPLAAPSLIRAARSFIAHLSLHHDIEETHVFPMLAVRMPAFAAAGPAAADHRAIHDGLDDLGAYVEACAAGERALRREEVRGILEGFGGVLWRHLDEEVALLGWENMTRFWSVEEIVRMRM